MGWMEAAVRWYAVLAAITWALAPGVRWLCRRLPDRGVTVARPLAVLAAIYPAWLLASLDLISFTGGAIVSTVTALGIWGWVATIREADSHRAWLRGLLIAEAASALLFGAYIWLRGFTPRILGTEKPMDIAFLASSARALSIPPPDPWFAGEPINYYYLGYLLHGSVTRLSGVAPETGFNLALAAIFSATTVAAFGVARNVLGAWSTRNLAVVGGFLAAFGVAIAGNLYAPWRLIQDAPGTISAWWWDSSAGIGWRSSRIVCDGPRVDNLCPAPSPETINEFPFFSFLLGDVHPHVMALPYSIVAIALAWNLWLGNAEAEHGKRVSWWIRIALSGAAVGALYPLNAWDVPVYLLLMAIGVWIGAGASLRTSWKSVALLAASAVIAWLPFLATYAPPTTESAGTLPVILARVPGLSRVLSAIGLHLGERTSVTEYLTIFGIPFLFGLVLLLVVWKSETESAQRVDLRMLGIAAAATIVPGVLLSAPVIPLCGIPLAVALGFLSRNQSSSPRAFALLLFALAWTLSIGVELVYIRDAFDDRMNTLFKFYYQVWTLYAVAAAATVAIVWGAAVMVWQRAMLMSAVLASVAAGIAYPAVASWQWTEGFASWQGLDGIAYAEANEADDVAAIRWLAQHAQPGDVVLEAAGCSYYPFDQLPFNRVSAFTGIPTIVGWGNHERQWRAGQPERIAEIGPRQADVARIYADPAGTLVDRYDIAWLFVGEYETGDWRAECETAGPYEGITSRSFPGPGWEEAFRSGDTRLYRRLPE